MLIQAGKCYYRKAGLTVSVRKVERLDGDLVHYRVLCGPQLKQRETNCTRLKKFAQWATGETDELDDYSHLGGCRRFPTFLVRDTHGRLFFRCTERKANVYLRKGYAVEVEPGVLQMTTDAVEKRLHQVHNGQFSEFFMAVKNDRCVVCGAEHPLTRHHVVPRRVKKRIPRPVRARLSNVLFVCVGCHERYEQTPEPSPELGDDALAFCRAWQDHFVAVLRPRFLPVGWEVVSVAGADPA
jgi:hypothetical protein